MKLLHPEIDVVPGRRAQQPVPEGLVGPGSAVVRLTDTTSQENAYTVRLRCGHPYWQEDWYAVKALPPAAGDENASAASKQDQYGPNNRWVKVYVSRGGSRDVLISFNLPERPEARAGKYPLKVVIETHVSGPGAASRRTEHFSELPAVAIVRPFYKWRLDLLPEESRVGLFRRVAQFEAVVVNEGNDWLYCDLKLPRQKELLLEAPTLRLAVPPPEPGADSFQRSAPVYAVTRLKSIRGDQTAQPLPLTAVRVDAPSVPPLPEEAHYGGVGANLEAAVVAVETGEALPVPGDRSLTYCPLVPSTLTGFIGAAIKNAKSLAMTLLGLFVLLNIGVLAYEHFFHDVKAEPLSSRAPDGSVTIGGRYLTGSKIFIAGKDGKPPEEVESPKEDPGGAMKLKKITDLPEKIRNIPEPERQYVDVKVDTKRYNGKEVKFVVQRAGILPYLGPLLPKDECRDLVLIGKILQPPPQPLIFPVSGDVKRGDRLTLSGQALGKEKGKVSLGGVLIEDILKWAPSQIVVKVPEQARFGAGLVVVVTQNGKQVSGGAVNVVPPPPPTPVTPLPPGGDNASTAAGGVPSTPTVTAASLLLQGNNAAALAEAEGLLQQNANDPMGLAVKGYVLAVNAKDKQMLKMALDPLYKAEQLTQNKKGLVRAVALTGIGRMYEKAGAKESAKTHYEDAVKAAPDFTPARDALKSL